jgi:hypothetical protein
MLMGVSLRRRRTGVIAGLALALPLALAQVAFADTVNLTRFSQAVSGTGATGATSVTVDLLRNSTDVHNNVVRGQVDTFTTPVTAGAWSGSFTKHAFSGRNDQVEIDYTGGATPQETIGEGLQLPTDTNHFSVAADRLDGHIGIASDGMHMRVDAGSSWSATVNGTTVPTLAGNLFTFSAPVTNGDAVLVTATFPDTTTVNLTDTAPLLTPLALGDTPPAINDRSDVNCSAYLVTSEVVCRNLTPGTYTLKHGSLSQSISVPAQTDKNDHIPWLGGAAVPGLAAGDTVQLLSGTHVLTNLTIDPMTYTRTRPLGDLQNGSRTTVTGTCTPGLFFTQSQFTCGSGGAIPAVNDLGNSTTTVDSAGVGEPGVLIGQTDETSAGETVIDAPNLEVSGPFFAESIHTPYNAFGKVFYDDPVALAAFTNMTSPAVGPTPVFPSTASNAVVTFSYGPFGATTLTPLGNVDILSNESTFFDQGNATGPAGANGQAPQGPAAPSCSQKGKLKGKKKLKTLIIRCASSTTDARVAVWLQRGNSIVTDGDGVVRNGAATVTFKAKLKKGNYRMFVVIDSGGLATSFSKTITVK